MRPPIGRLKTKLPFQPRKSPRRMPSPRELMTFSMAVRIAKNPGRILEERLLAREPHLRPHLLKRLERQAKELGDLETMRAIKEYREASRQISPKIPS